MKATLGTALVSRRPQSTHKADAARAAPDPLIKAHKPFKSALQDAGKPPRPGPAPDEGLKDRAPEQPEPGSDVTAEPDVAADPVGPSETAASSDPSPAERKQDRDGAQDARPAAQEQPVPQTPDKTAKPDEDAAAAGNSDPPRPVSPAGADEKAPPTEPDAKPVHPEPDNEKKPQQTPASAERPDAPLTIHDMNRLLLQIDPAVLRIRQGTASLVEQGTGGAETLAAGMRGGSIAGGQHGSGAESRAISGTESRDGAPPRGQTPGAEPSGTATQAGPIATGAAPADARRATDADAAPESQKRTDSARIDTKSAGVDQPTPKQGVQAGVGASKAQAAAAVRAGLSQTTKPGATVKPASPTSVGPVGSTSAENGSASVRLQQAQNMAQRAPDSTLAALQAQVTRGLHAALQQRGGRVTLRLQPENLGHLRIEMTIKGQSVSARFETASREAHDLLNRSLTHLRQTLEAKGLHVERLHVHAGDAPHAHRADGDAPQGRPAAGDGRAGDGGASFHGDHPGDPGDGGGGASGDPRHGGETGVPQDGAESSDVPAGVSLRWGLDAIA